MEDQESIRRSSVQNALRLINLFTVDEPELGISELSEKLGLAKSTVHRLVTTMANEGFIAKDRHSNLYRLGVSILALSNVVTSSMEIHRVASPILHELATKKANESVHLAIFREDEVIFLIRIDCARSIRSLSLMGSRVPAHCTSSGQVFLADLPKEALERIVKKGLKSYTEKTITEPGQLYALLNKIKEQGFSISIEEFHRGVASVAAPIRNARGKAIATVSIAGPVQRMTKEAMPHLTKLALKAAGEISQRFGQPKQSH